MPWILLALAYNKTHIVYPFVPILMLTSSGGSNAAPLRLLQWPLSPQVILSLLPLVQAAYSKVKHLTLNWLSGLLYSSNAGEEVDLDSPSLLLTSPTPASFTDSRLQINIQTDNPSDSAIDEVVIVRHLKRIIAALTLPFVASALGHFVLRRSEVGNLNRSLVGAAIWTVGADVGSALMRYWLFKWRCSRRILNYPKAA